MENEQIVLKISAFEQFEKQTNEKIEKLEERQNNLEELTKAFSVMQNEQEHIKTDVKQLVSKPAKRYDAIIDKVVLSLVGAFVGFVLCKIGM